VIDAVDDERAGTPPRGGDPAPEHEPQAQEIPRDDLDHPAADPRITIAGRYAVDLQTPPAGAGVAVTYQGRDLRTRDPVVVKTLRFEYRGDPEMRARFRREARLLQFLSHPNVIRALAFSEERGAPWLVLERIRGRSLREEIDMSAPFAPEEVMPLLQGVATALDHLHARGLAHLDVRPENVIVTPDGDAKLIDFGVAQAAGSMQEFADGSRPDNVAYLAPEQVCGEPVSPATDVFALGCVVYELLTGRPPFVLAEEPAAMNAAIRARLEQAPLPPSIARGGDALPVWVDDVVLGALERDPRQRYGSAGSFAAVFHSGVEGDIDVETGRPRRRVEPPPSRQIPNNEPGIALKGSAALASRRGISSPDVVGGRDDVVDAAFASLSTDGPVVLRSAQRPRSRDLTKVGRRLWQAVILAAVLNVILIVALLMTRGEIPGIWHAGDSIRPGASVRIAGAGLVARASPDTESAIVADLPDGGSVRISGDPVAGDDGLWWPVEVETATGVVDGYVPESWVQAP
jgi:serine/threonine protein kinase